MGKLLAWLFAAGKLGKALTSGGTMLISVFAYALVYGWWYAVGFVLLIFFHEMGHFLAARNRGLDVGLPTFIPFVGAWVSLKHVPHNASTEAYVSIAGPLAGMLASIGCYWIARTTDSHLMLALAFAGFMLNLFNLIPVSPLDGGRIIAAIKKGGGTSELPSGYYDLSLGGRVNYAIFYLGLAGFLAIMSFEIHNTLSPYTS